MRKSICGISKNIAIFRRVWTFISVVPFGFINFSLNFIDFFHRFFSSSLHHRNNIPYYCLLKFIARVFFAALTTALQFFKKSFQVRVFHVKRYVIVVSPQTFYYFSCDYDFNESMFSSVNIALATLCTDANAKLFVNCDNAWKICCNVYDLGKHTHTRDGKKDTEREERKSDSYKCIATNGKRYKFEFCAKLNCAKWLSASTMANSILNNNEKYSHLQRYLVRCVCGSDEKPKSL